MDNLGLPGIEKPEFETILRMKELTNLTASPCPASTAPNIPRGKVGPRDVSAVETTWNQQ